MACSTSEKLIVAIVQFCRWRHCVGSVQSAMVGVFINITELGKKLTLELLLPGESGRKIMP